MRTVITQLDIQYAINRARALGYYKTPQRYITKKEYPNAFKLEKTIPKKDRYDRTHLDMFYAYRGKVTMCMQCGDNNKLQVHHKDKNHFNNNYENLIKLCINCHTNAHKGDRVYSLMKKQI